jgi:hypothetical protein
MISVTLLDNEDTEILGEDSKLHRKIIAPLLSEDELHETQTQRSIQLTINQHRFEELVLSRFL